uniref:Uncharacterized protein n=1 Tax=Fagus sylvatica TaxID=28930 RepID=A0A2N9F866_FAGSY
MSDFDELGIVRKACATLSLQGFRVAGNRARDGEIWSGEQRSPECFWSFRRAFFLVRIPARPEKVLTIREFHTMHEYVFFPMCPGSRINLLRARKTLRASATMSAEKLWKLQHSLILSTCFHSRGRRSSRSRNSAILAYRQKACATILSKAEATLLRKGFHLRTKLSPVGKNPRVNTLPSKGVVSSIQPSVQSTVRSNLGQTRSTLVKPGQTWSKFSELWEMYPGPRFEGFGHSGPQSGQKRLGQLLVNPGQTWSTLVKFGQTLGNVSLDPVLMLFAWRALVGSGRFGSGCLVLRADTRENPGGTAKNLPQFTCHFLSDALALNRLTHGSKVKISCSESSFAFLRCLTEVVVAEIVAGPHALDSCECMNIEGAMRAPSRWLLLCLLGRSALASHTLGLAIS